MFYDFVAFLIDNVMFILINTLYFHTKIVIRYE